MKIVLDLSNTEFDHMVSKLLTTAQNDASVEASLNSALSRENILIDENNRMSRQIYDLEHNPLPLPLPRPMPMVKIRALLTACKNGQKIQAIKLVREMGQCDLRTSKEIVEQTFFIPNW